MRVCVYACMRVRVNVRVSVSMRVSGCMRVCVLYLFVCNLILIRFLILAIHVYT